MNILNWRKRKKDDDIILDCYTYNPYAYNFAKINYGHHYIPEWWKNTPKVVEKNATIKNCPAFVEYYKKGIVLPMWCEVELQIKLKGDGLYTWKSAQKEFSILHHEQEQFEGFTKEDGHNLKIMSPWFIKCKEEIDFTFSEVTNLFHEHGSAGTAYFINVTKDVGGGRVREYYGIHLHIAEWLTLFKREMQRARNGLPETRYLAQRAKHIWWVNPRLCNPVIDSSQYSPTQKRNQDKMVA